MCKTVAEYIGDDGNWNLDAIRELLLDQYWQEVLGSAPPSMENDDDRLVWGGSNDGCFTIKSAYEKLRHPSSLQTKALFSMIWKWPGPEHICCLLWRTAHNSLPTNAWRYSRFMTSEAICVCCHEERETSLHALRDCAWAKATWQAMMGQITI
uniref:Ribonuclease H protein At1g65750 family n=2 Tax=Cajanus cajan TaxID=3821 RepID=A0A151R851_CAJCA|nr:Putative ribonuclease H protein At1g65750 family [Cajanus cajan]